MYVVKENVSLKKNVKLTENIEIKNHELIALVENDRITYKDGKWYINGVFQGEGGYYRLLVNEEDMIINKNKLEIHSHLKESANINKKLVENGILVESIYQNFDSLEEYFMKRIGE